MMLFGGKDSYFLCERPFFLEKGYDICFFIAAIVLYFRGSGGLIQARVRWGQKCWICEGRDVGQRNKVHQFSQVASQRRQMECEKREHPKFCS